MNATKEQLPKQPRLKEQRIRELAYQIWETEGCPHGEADRHWQQASKLAEIEVSDTPKSAPDTHRLSKPHAADASTVAAPKTTMPEAPRSRPAKNDARPKHDA